MSVRDQRSIRQFCLAEVEVRPSDIKSVKDAICGTDPAMLAEHILVGQAGWDPGVAALEGAAWGMLVSRVSAVVELIAEIPPDARAYAPYLIVPLQRFSRIGAGAFGRSVGAALVDVERLAAAAPLIEGLGGYQASPAALDTLLDALVSGSMPGAELLDGICSEGLDLADAPWPEVLGCRMWLPAGLTPTEAAMSVSHVLWSMTYRGFGVDWARMAERGYAHAMPAPSPDAAYEAKLGSFEELLNYNSWLSAIGAASALVRAC